MSQIRSALRAIVLFAVASTGQDADDGKITGTSFAASPGETTVQKYSSWMSRLPDTVLLSRVSLPGTHDSCALRDGLSFGFARCQSWQLADQLKAGIRFLDIRCRHVGDRFLIYHGVIDQKMTFNEVRDICREFLQQHPTESIVMSVKEESTARDNSRSFKETFTNSIRNDGRLWHISSRIPALKSVRGRIVLLDRVGDLGGFKWQNLNRQDQYKAPVDLKAKLIRSHFKEALAADGDQWFINFCSGTLPESLTTPGKYALRSNKVAFEFLNQPGRRVTGRLGTVVMDFPGEELIERIVETNFAGAPAN